MDRAKLRGSLQCALVAALYGLAGCSMPRPVDAPADFSITSPRTFAGSEPSAEQASNRAVHTDLIRGMLAQQQYYAALAHIQDQQSSLGNTDELRYLEAEARRSLGQQAEAEKLYRTLLSGRFDAEAHHGLGLLYAPRDLTAAVQHLRQAVQRRPTDARARNDLGYALMIAGRYAEALPEIATAVELDPDGEKARNNLIILLILTGDEAAVKRVAASAQVPAGALAGLRKQAHSLNSRGNRGGQ